MGNFYVNYTLKGPDPKAVVSALAGRKCVVSPSRQGCIVVFDEASDAQNKEVITKLGAELSRRLSCPVLAVLNHDDDILWYQLYEAGGLADEYDSTPGYFEMAEESLGPAGGDAAKLCAAFGGDPEEVEAVLRSASLEDDGYVFAFERHEELVRALGLPEFAVGIAYKNFSGGDLPDGLPADEFLRTQ